MSEPLTTKKFDALLRLIWVQEQLIHAQSNLAKANEELQNQDIKDAGEKIKTAFETIEDLKLKLGVKTNGQQNP